MTIASTFLHFSGIITPFSPFPVKHFLELFAQLIQESSSWIWVDNPSPK